jgi:hypothetical protein
MDNVDELERQRATNRERQRRRREQGSQEERDIENERRSKVIAKERHTGKKNRRDVRYSDNLIIKCKIIF